ncbi:hypothetical protein FX988_00280 [Paraglaciecola mesophila]|uniref:Copper-binding protein n=1 Tax=Paraglaciecola mesophila TaxID=197222 RepID=A0A857JGG8_9ALTE|nr:hypothetical protein [Paraglaciecola mesophila]QHJ10071.1 hypothetical protein FX988_00280 [Paraglaciecola mesophila]
MSHKFTSYLLIVLLLAVQSFGVNGMACVAMEMQASQQNTNTTMSTSSGISTMSHANMPMGDVTKAQSAQYEANKPCAMQLNDVSNFNAANSHASMDNDDKDSEMNMECCDKDSVESCHCPEAACSAAVVIAYQGVILSLPSEDKIISVLFSTPDPFQSKAKRPPIFG